MTSQDSWGQQYAMAGDVPGIDPHAATGIAAWFAPGLALVSAALGAFGLWLANRMLGKAAFEQAMNSRFQVLMEQSAAFHATERTAWHEERLQLRGEIINLKQTVATLTNAVRAAGVAGLPETDHPNPIITLEADPS